MNNFKALTKVELKNYWRMMSANMGLGKRKWLASTAIIWVLFAFGIMATQLAYAMFQGFAQSGYPELSFTIIYLMASLMVMFLSFSALINLFYYSKNTGFLLTLPITENTIILSRLSVQYIYSLVMTSVLVIPSLLIYFINTGWTIMGILGGIVAILLAPVAPLLIATLLVMLLMNTIGRSINRRVMSVIINFAVIGIIIGTQAIVARQSIANDFIVNLMLSNNGLLYYLGLRFPPVVWATQMITGSVLSLGLFLILNIVLIAIVNQVTRPLVRNTLRNYNQAEAKARKHKANYEGRSIVGALIRRNLLIIVKTPAFMMNALLLILLPFIMVGVNMLTGAAAMQEWQGLIAKLAEPNLQPLIALIIAAVLIMPALMGTFSATVITREGKYLWQTKVAPISAKDDIKARIISCGIIVFIGMIVLVPVSIWILPLSIADLVWAFLIAIPAVYGMLVIDIVIDINRPILNWVSPTQAIKNNMNIMFGLAWRLLVGLAVFFVLKIGGSFITLASLKYWLAVIMVVLAIVGHFLMKRAIPKYANLEII